MYVAEGNVGKWGYIDSSGALVIQPQFDSAREFSEGLAWVADGEADDARYGFIDKTGAVVIPMQYEGPLAFPSLAPRFSDGLCRVGVEDDTPPASVTSTSLVGESPGFLYGYMDKTGAMAIEAEFSQAWDFAEGLAAVMRAADGSTSGFIDTDGHWVITLPPELTFFGVSRWAGFSEGLAPVCEFVLPEGAEVPHRTPAHCGFIDATGDPVIEPQFDEVLPFSEGLAAVALEEDGARRWGYIDKTGAWAIEPQFDYATPFAEGLAPVAVRVAGEPGGDAWITDYDWGYIDKNGVTIIPLQYQSAYPFSGGVAWVGKWERVDTPAGVERVMEAYIDTTGKVIWQGE